MEQIGVLGAGQMGAGIAQVFASQGFKVELFDVNEAGLKKAQESILASLAKLVKKQTLTEEKAHETFKNIRFSLDMGSQKASDLIIEAVPEQEILKTSLYKKLETFLGDEAILATNTSSISITRLGACLKRPERFLGMHFMNPVPLMPLVEMTKGLLTDAKIFEQALGLCERVQKVPIISLDYPGFIVNRILMPMINEAFFVLMEGIASKEDIDRSMKLGANYPMGPLTLADFIGLDTCLSIMEVLLKEMGDSKYRPCPLLRRYVEAGLLGRKCGRGVYLYT